MLENAAESHMAGARFVRRYLGMTAMRTNYDKLIHRTDRSDWSIFRMGLAFFDYCLNLNLRLPVSFCLLNIKTVW